MISQNNLHNSTLFYPLVTGTDNPLLRRTSEPVTCFDSELQEFSQALIELMYHYDGVGLAAPQLGKNIRAIAITLWGSRKQSKCPTGDMVLINPTLLSHSQETSIGSEGCLSVPGISGNVRRYKTVKIAYFTPTGEKITQTFTGFTAVIVQHEMDHLDGILFVDKLTSEK